MKCPKCGCETFIRKYAVTGIWWEVIKYEDGKEIHVEGNTDDIRAVKTEPKTVRCSNCNHRLKNPARATAQP